MRSFSEMQRKKKRKKKKRKWDQAVFRFVAGLEEGVKESRDTEGNDHKLAIRNNAEDGGIGGRELEAMDRQVKGINK